MIVTKLSQDNATPVRCAHVHQSTAHGTCLGQKPVPASTVDTSRSGQNDRQSPPTNTTMSPTMTGPRTHPRKPGKTSHPRLTGPKNQSKMALSWVYYMTGRALGGGGGWGWVCWVILATLGAGAGRARAGGTSAPVQGGAGAFYSGTGWGRAGQGGGEFREPACVPESCRHSRQCSTVSTPSGNLLARFEKVQTVGSAGGFDGPHRGATGDLLARQLQGGTVGSAGRLVRRSGNLLARR
jgi:hypothetical protein